MVKARLPAAGWNPEQRSMAFDALKAMTQNGSAQLSFSDLRDLVGVDVETATGAAALAAWAERNGCQLDISSILKMVTVRPGPAR